MKRCEQVRMHAASRGRGRTFWLYTPLAPPGNPFLRNESGMLLKTKGRGSEELERTRNIFENKGFNTNPGML